MLLFVWRERSKDTSHILISPDNKLQTENSEAPMKQINLTWNFQCYSQSKSMTYPSAFSVSQWTLWQGSLTVGSCSLSSPSMSICFKKNANPMYLTLFGKIKKLKFSLRLFKQQTNYLWGENWLFQPACFLNEKPDGQKWRCETVEFRNFEPLKRSPSSLPLSLAPH